MDLMSSSVAPVTSFMVSMTFLGVGFRSAMVAGGAADLVGKGEGVQKELSCVGNSDN
jgi:hypothetical protein